MKGKKAATESRPGLNIGLKVPVPQCRGAHGTFWAPWTGMVMPFDWKLGLSEYSVHLFQPIQWRDPARWLSGLDQILWDLVSGQSKALSLGAHCPKPTGSETETAEVLVIRNNQSPLTIIRWLFYCYLQLMGWFSCSLQHLLSNVWRQRNRKSQLT